MRSANHYASEQHKASCLVLRGLMLMLVWFCGADFSTAQTLAIQSGDSSTSTRPKWQPPLKNEIARGLLFSQLEDREDGHGSGLRWDSEAWVGTDMSRLWLKSEGLFKNGKMSDGDHEVLYDRPIPRLRYFDVQLGVREDLDSGPNRTWGAVGFEGLAPDFLQLESTFYFRESGHVAGKMAAAYDLRMTRRFIAQPQAEVNFYGGPDSSRHMGTGLADLDAGLRLRYTTRHKLDPYAGFTYTSGFGTTAAYSRQAGEPVSSFAFVVGLRAWK